MSVRIFLAAWLATALLTGVLLAETSPAESTSATKAGASPRSLSAIQADASAALRAEAITRRTGDNTPQVLRLVQLCREIAAHPKREKSAMLEQLGQQLRSRLATVRDRIKSQVAKGKNTGKRQRNSPTTAAPRDRVLAQQIAPQAGGAAAAQGMGVQVAGIAGQNRAGTLPTDFGPELVELIEATISPAVWKVNGGNSAIVYYSPLHVLVVSAPDEIHAQIGDAVGQLRAAQQRLDGAQVVVGAGLNRAGN